MPALMGAPDLLVLDEPTSGFDPIAQHQIHEVMRDAAAAGRTVFLSSHVLSEVGRVADRVGLIRSGRLLTVERIAELRARSAHLVDARVAGPLDARDFADVPGVVRRTVADGAFHHEVTGSSAPSCASWRAATSSTCPCASPTSTRCSSPSTPRPTTARSPPARVWAVGLAVLWGSDLTAGAPLAGLRIGAGELAVAVEAFDRRDRAT